LDLLSSTQELHIVMSHTVAPVVTDDLPADLPAVLEELSDSDPALARAFVRALKGAESPALRAAANHVGHALARNSSLDSDVDAVVSHAVRAQEMFENWTDGRIDALLRDIATTFADQAEALAAATVRETGLGNVADKTLKNRFASLTIYQSLAGKVAQGQLAVDVERQVTDLASPVGVVFAITPVTNPVETAIFKTLIALKSRNALIVSFPRQALGVGGSFGMTIRGVLAAHRAPLDLVQIVQLRPGRKTTRRFMSHPNVALVLATGGASLVKAAYASGTPAIGVGPGNAPAWICVDADLDRAAWSIVTSKAFDNGLICGAEHNLVVDDRVAAPFAEALQRHGAAVLSRDEDRLFRLGAVDEDSGVLRREFIGQSAAAIAGAVGIVRPYTIRLLVVHADASMLNALHAGEKLAPWLSLFTASGEDHGLQLCRRILDISGAGHTAIVHSTNRARVERFARVMPVGRILVNAPGAQGCCGLATGLERSLSLGCGTFGGNSTTDNVTYRHLLNIKRLAYSLQQEEGDGVR
jgi:acyl-CoA reductase-like NAD-dependent aldehyde dehydrogenase